MRIVTRPDFDGVVCAVLLKAVHPIDQPIKWVEPGDMQKKMVEIIDGDIIANLPFHEKCSLWFDHHYSNRPGVDFAGAYKLAPSAAAVVFEYYRDRFGKNFTGLVSQTDKIDSADLTEDEVIHPENYPYVLLSMTISGREAHDEKYWNRLVELLGSEGIDRVISDPEVVARCREVVKQNEHYKTLLEKYTRMEAHVSITDFRELGKTPAGNRFLSYSLFPDSIVNVKIRYDNHDPDKLIVSVGHSIFNRNCHVNVGAMLTGFEGGGHEKAGACSFDASNADDYIPKIIDILLKNEGEAG
jgi:oligoribonuclease NrnB/cAMP/cGMP phosphodiesterase (DHH superfamily)